MLEGLLTPGAGALYDTMVRTGPLPLDDPRAESPEMRELFDRALDELGGLHRQVVWLREVRGLSYPEIASRLGIPEGTVKVQLHRARVKLRRAYAS